MYRHPGQVMLILNWLRWCWLPFSTAGQAALFGRSLRSAHGRCGRYGVSNRLFGILPHGRFVSCLPFTYSVIYFYHYELIDIYFIHQDIFQYYFILLLKLFQAWPLGDLLFCSYDSLACPINVGMINQSRHILFSLLYHLFLAFPFSSFLVPISLFTFAISSYLL